MALAITGEGLEQYSALSVRSGPNNGYVVLAELPRLKQWKIYLNRALDGEGAWAQAQGRGGSDAKDPTSGLPLCTPAAFARLKPFVEAHEGVHGEANSHFGRWQKTFAASDLPARWESLIATSGAALAVLADAAYNKLIEGPAAKAVQDQLDDEDTPKIPTWSGGCAFNATP